jgi:hypothetical protein
MEYEASIYTSVERSFEFLKTAASGVCNISESENHRPQKP